MATVDVTSIVGMPQESKWPRVIHYSFDDYTCVVVYSVAGPEAQKFGRDIEHIVLSSLPQTSEDLYSLLTDIVSTYNILHLEFSCLVINKDALFVATYNGHAVLLRSKKRRDLLSTTNEVGIIEGRWREDDSYVLIVHSSENFISEIILRFKQGFDAAGVVDAISSALMRDDDHAPQGVSLVTLTAPKEELFVAQPTFDTDNTQQTVSTELPYQTTEHADSSELAKETKSSKVAFVQSLVTGLRLLPFIIRKKFKSIKIKKKYIVIISMLIVALGLGLFVTFRYISQSQAQMKQLEAQLEPLHQELLLARDEKDTNTIDARKKTTDVIVELQTIKKNNDASKALSKRVEEEIEFASSLYDEMVGANEVSDLPVFLDLRSTKSDFIATAMTAVEKNITLIDKEKKTLILLNSESKQTSITELETNTIKSVGANDSALLLLADGIYKKNLSGEQELQRVVTASESAVVGANIVQAYDDFVYVFNSEKRNIYRYTVDEDTAGKAMIWLKTTKGVDFETITDMVVDGNVWLSSNKGEIYKFLQGTQQAFTISDLSTPFNSALTLFSARTSENIYVLEPEQSRVVVLSKNGEFVKEIKSPLLASATDLVADETIKKIIVLNGSLLFELTF